MRLTKGERTIETTNADVIKAYKENGFVEAKDAEPTKAPVAKTTRKK